ncbi:hypothetical protein MFRU_003g04860 [Monilinia fructicola]|nr:hypothetical protein MFRU_003g04860 [Monilinia fructicola]
MHDDTICKDYGLSRLYERDTIRCFLAHSLQARSYPEFSSSICSFCAQLLGSLRILYASIISFPCDGLGSTTNLPVHPRHITSAPEPYIAISSQFSALQVLWSIAQTCIGSYILYQSRGSQLDIYGHAAFGLTVIPYVIASIINLLGSLVGRRGGVIGSVDQVGNDDENLHGEDELGKLGNSTVIFRSNGDREERFICEVTTSEDFLEYTLLPPETTISSTPQTKTKRLKQHLIEIFGDPAKIEKRLACQLRKQKKEKSILEIPSHSSFTRLPPSHWEPAFLILASLILITAVLAPYIIIYILTVWQKRRATSNQTMFTIHWLCLGQTSGLVIAKFERHTKRSY